MSKNEKLSAIIHNNLKGVRFNDACKMAEILGFDNKRIRGSHHVYGRKDEAKLLNFQNRNGYIPSYQTKQLIEMMDRYEKKNIEK